MLRRYARPPLGGAIGRLDARRPHGARSAFSTHRAMSPQTGARDPRSTSCLQGLSLQGTPFVPPRFPTRSAASGIRSSGTPPPGPPRGEPAGAGIPNVRPGPAKAARGRRESGQPRAHERGTTVAGGRQGAYRRIAHGLLGVGVCDERRRGSTGRRSCRTNAHLSSPRCASRRVRYSAWLAVSPVRHRYVGWRGESTASLSSSGRPCLPSTSCGTDETCSPRAFSSSLPARHWWSLVRPCRSRPAAHRLPQARRCGPRHWCSSAHPRSRRCRCAHSVSSRHCCSRPQRFKDLQVEASRR